MLNKLILNDDFFVMSSLYMKNISPLTPYPEDLWSRDFPFTVIQLLSGCLCWPRHCFWHCNEINMKYNGHSQRFYNLVAEARS